MSDYEQAPLPGDDNFVKGGGIGGGTNFGGGNSGGGRGGGGGANPFIPTFGGQAPGWGGLGPSAVWGGQMRRRLMPMGAGRMAFNGGAQQMGNGGGYRDQGAGIMSGSPMGQGGQASPFPGAPPWMTQWAQQQNPANQVDPTIGHPFQNGPMGPIGALMQNAFLGGDPNYGGAFSLNGSDAVRSGMRSQAIQDAGARDRAARLGLQARGDADPSTYGFQALMSQLGGQDQTARTMGQADLAMKQQQMQQYWQMMSQLLAGQFGVDQTERQGRWGAANQPSPWGQVAGGIGSVLGNSILGQGISRGAGGGGGAQGPRMGEGGFQYPFMG